MPRRGFTTLLGSGLSHSGYHEQSSYTNQGLMRASNQTYATNEMNESCATNVSNAIDVERTLNLTRVSA